MIYAVGIVAVILGVVLDQFTKYLATTHIKDNPITLIEGVFELRYLENRGAALECFKTSNGFFLL